MPSRRRGQEANRARRRIERLARPVPEPPTIPEQIDRSWREVTDPDLIFCCPDCDPGHPANLEREVTEQIAAWRESEPA